MARYRTMIDSTLPPEEAFAYLADFANARHWDPSVVEAARRDPAVLGQGSSFDLAVKFGGRTIPMRYAILSYDEPNVVVLESRKPRFTSRDEITVAEAVGGSSIRYDALLELKGVARAFEPILRLLLNRTGDRAAAGLHTALNP